MGSSLVAVGAALGIERSQLARSAGITYSHLLKLEAGQRTASIPTELLARRRQIASDVVAGKADIVTLERVDHELHRLDLAEEAIELDEENKRILQEEEEQRQREEERRKLVAALDELEGSLMAPSRPLGRRR